MWQGYFIRPTDVGTGTSQHWRRARFCYNVNVFGTCTCMSYCFSHGGVTNQTYLFIDSIESISYISRPPLVILLHYAQTCLISHRPNDIVTYSNEMSYITINMRHIKGPTFIYLMRQLSDYVRNSQKLFNTPLGLEAFLIWIFYLDGCLLHINPAQPSNSWTEIWRKYRVPLEVSAWAYLLLLLLINYLPEVWLGIPCWNTTQRCVFPFFFASLCSLFALLSMPVDLRSISSLEMSFRGLGNTRFEVSWIMYGTVAD